MDEDECCCGWDMAMVMMRGTDEIERSRVEKIEKRKRDEGEKEAKNGLVSATTSGEGRSKTLWAASAPSERD